MDYLIMCIGNRNEGDDAIGPYISDKLKKKENNSISIRIVGALEEVLPLVASGKITIESIKPYM